MMGDYYDEKFSRSGFSLRMCALGFIGIIVFLLISLLFGSCKEIQYVPMVETKTEHHWHTDTVKQTDSVFNNQTTVIREVDSATMAQFGIRLKAAERAWLIQNDRLQREIERLQAIHYEADSVHDSIPVPYPVEKELTWWQERKIEFGELALVVIAGLLCFLFFRYKFG